MDKSAAKVSEASGELPPVSTTTTTHRLTPTRSSMTRPTPAADLREPYRMVVERSGGVNDGKTFVEFGRYVLLSLTMEINLLNLDSRPSVWREASDTE